MEKDLPRPSYEQYSVTIAIDLVREIIRMLDVGPASSPDQDKTRRCNINRAYNAIDALKKIDL